MLTNNNSSLINNHVKMHPSIYTYNIVFNRFSLNSSIFIITIVIVLKSQSLILVK